MIILGNVIHMENVSKLYGDKLALDNITLQVRKGEAFGLIGPNGAGKTTMIMLLLGILKPSSGKIMR